MYYKGMLFQGAIAEASTKDILKGDGIKVTEGNVIIDRTDKYHRGNLSLSLKEKLAKTLENDVIVNLLGRTIRYKPMSSRLKRLGTWSKLKS